MHVPVGTIKSVIEKVDTIMNWIDSTVPADTDTTQAESDALKLIPSLMDELQRYVDDNPPWKG